MDYETVRRLFNYDPETGVMTWRASISCHRAGSRAGSPSVGVIRRLKFEGVYYQLPRLIWLWMTGNEPPGSVDHKNGDGLDDRWENLGSVSVDGKMTAELVRELLDYDPESGKIIWRVNRHKHRAGTDAGVVDRSGYRRVKIGGVSYAASRLIWLWVEGVWPENEIDHQNLEKDDNRWNNLREATRANNTWNTPIRKDSGTGFKGVVRRGPNLKTRNYLTTYQAWIKVDRRKIYLGSARTAEEAAKLYADAAVLYHKQFARS